MDDDNFINPLLDFKPKKKRVPKSVYHKVYPNKELLQRAIINATANKIDTRRVLKGYEIEDIAKEFVSKIEHKITQKRKEPKTISEWNWIKTLRYGTNKISVFKDDLNEYHIVVSGGVHNVNFNLEGNKLKFFKQFGEALGYKFYRSKSRRGAGMILLNKK